MLVIALVLIFSASGGGRPDRRVAVPSSAGSYRLIRSMGGGQVRALLGNQLGSLGPISQALDTARIGVYGTGQNPLPTVVFLGFNRADSGAIESLLSGSSPQLVAHELLAEAGSGASQTFATGPFGGSLQCAQASKDGTAYTPCVWVDRTTLALVLRVGDTDLGAAAGITRQFRAAAEH